MFRQINKEKKKEKKKKRKKKCLLNNLAKTLKCSIATRTASFTCILVCSEAVDQAP